MSEEFKEKIKKQIEVLNNERAKMLQIICEDDKLYVPEIILNIVFRVRSITKTIQSLNILLYGNEFKEK